MADPAFDLLSASPPNGAALATGGTIAFQYPAGRAPGSYWGQWPARMNVRTLQANFVQDTDFTISYDPTQITVTYTAATTIPAGAVCKLQVPVLDTSDAFDQKVNVAPAGADAQYVIDGAFPTDGLADNDPTQIMGN